MYVLYTSITHRCVLDSQASKCTNEIWHSDTDT